MYNYIFKDQIRSFMSFIFDKPLIVRVMMIVMALAGVFMIYVGFAGGMGILYSAVTVMIGAACIVCGLLIHLQRQYAWHATLLLLGLSAIYFLIAYTETFDMLWMVFLLLDAAMILLWCVRFTRAYFGLAEAA